MKLKQIIVMSVVVLCVVTWSVQAAVLTWTEDTTVPNKLQYGFTGVDTVGGNVYVSGFDQNAGYAGVVFKKSGGVWTNMGAGSGAWLNSVSATGASNVWSAGNGRIDHYNGTSWSQTSVAGEVAAIDSSSLMNAVASRPFGGVARTITSDGGATWTALPAGVGDQDRAVIMNSPTDIWFGTGDSGTWTAYAQHYNGTTYDKTYTLPIASGYTASKVTGFAQGGGQLYAVGMNQATWRYDSGSDTWSFIAHPWANYVAHRAAAVDPTTGDLYVVGDRGMIWSYDLSAGIWEEQLYLDHWNTNFASIAISNGILYAVGNGESGASAGVWMAEIPEPATMSLLGLGIVALIRRQRS